MEILSPNEARHWYDSLPVERKIETLSPDYVLADAVRDNSLVPIFLGYREGENFWLHGVHKGKVLDTKFFDFQSPYGYGGPISNNSDEDFLRRAWDKYVDWCTTHSILAEFVRLHPLAKEWQPYGGEVCSDRKTVVIPLSNGDFRSKYELRCRTSVRKARKAGVLVKALPTAEIATRFAGFYRQGMIDIGASEFYQFNDDYFNSLASLPGVTLLVCLQDGNWLAAGLFLNGGLSVEYHLSATNAIGRKLSATNLLIDAAAEIGAGLGKSCLYLGGGTNGDPENPLLFFKSGFSNQRIDFSYGFNVFLKEEYDRLKKSHLGSGFDSRMVLFYRGG